VPITQSYELFTCAQDNGVPAKFFAYPVTGHSPFRIGAARRDIDRRLDAAAEGVFRRRADRQWKRPQGKKCGQAFLACVGFRMVINTGKNALLRRNTMEIGLNIHRNFA